jgi:sugar lactone lactonase YvrE
MRRLSAQLLFAITLAATAFGQSKAVVAGGVRGPLAGTQSFTLPSGQFVDVLAGGGPPNGSMANAIALSNPPSVAVDSAGNIYVAAPPQNRVYQIATNGAVTILAGNGFAGYSGDGGPANTAQLSNPRGVAVDSSGNVYIADSNNVRIRQVSSGMITNVAGTGVLGYSGDNGPATSAQIFSPNGIAVDSAGNLYIADSGARVRKVSGGIITTVAGNGTFGFSGDGGPATSAQLSNPIAVAVDSVGSLYIADGCRIREVSGGIINTVAGNGMCGYAGDGGPATSAEISFAAGVAADSAGNFYIADTGNCRIREVSGGAINTVAGNGSCFFGGDNGPATSAALVFPAGVAVDASSNLYIADTNNGRIRKVSSGNITTIAGNGTYEYSGDNGPAINAQLNPGAIAATAAGSVFVVDYQDYRIREVSGGTITTAVGTGLPGYSGDGEPAAGAQIGNVNAIATDNAGDLYIADTCRIREVSGGTINTVAGTGLCGYSGDGGPATSAQVGSDTGITLDNSSNLYISDGNRIRKVSGGTISLVAGGGPPNGAGATAISIAPRSTAVDSSGNIYIADGNNNRVYKLSGGAITIVAGNGIAGFSGDNGPAMSAQLSNPAGVAVDSAGDLYIADANNGRIRKVAGGVITTVAGGGGGCSPETDNVGDGCPATAASLFNPNGVAVDASGNLYIADSFNYRVREVSGGVITTVAGNGTFGYSGDGGPATSAEISYSNGVLVDGTGSLYIADSNNFRVRKVSGGVITTVAGTGTPGFSGDGGPAANAQLNSPYGVAVDSLGNLYIADSGNFRIRKVSGGIITTVAGSGLCCGYSGDNGPAISAQLNFPNGIAVDSTGNLYIADTGNFRIREVSGGVITTIAGNGFASYSGDGGQATAAQLSSPQGLAVDGGGNLYIADSGSGRVRVVSPAGLITSFAGGGSQGTANGIPATNATLGYPTRLAATGGSLYIQDSGNGLLRKVSGGIITTIAALTTSVGFGSFPFPSGGGVAVDTMGDIYVSDPVDSVVQVIVPPTVYIDTPQGGASVSGTVTIAGWAIDSANSIGTAISGVQIKVDGTVLGSATYGIPRPDVCIAFPGRQGCPNVGYTYQLNAAALGPGSHTITVTATDSDGMPDAGSASIQINVSTPPPTVNIDGPASGSTVSGMVTVSGWAIDSANGIGTAISTVHVKVDGTVVGTATYGTARPDVCGAFPGRPSCPNVGYTYQLNTLLLSLGSHVITVVATDSDTPPDTASASVTVTVASTPPTVYIDLPAQGSSISGSATVSGWAIGNANVPVTSVQVKIDGGVARNAIYGIPRPDVCNVFPGRPGCPNVGYTYSLDTTGLAPGPHKIMVLATDSNGNTSSVNVNVSVPNTNVLPTVYIESPTAGAVIAGTVTVAGWAVDNAAMIGTAISKVQVTLDGIAVGQATYGTARPDVCSAFPGRPGCPNVGYTYQLNVSSVSAGSHRLCAIATDTDASADAGSYCITVQVPPPSVYIDTPQKGATVSGLVTVSGWAIDNATGAGTAINSVQVKVDGAAVGTATYGTPRPDVCSVFPGRPGCPNVGYTFQWNTGLLSPGSHTLTVSATDSDGIADLGSASVMVTK